jgi:hypothetical protein
MAIDQIDEMLAQSDKQPLALGITIHSFIVGQPFRLRQFRRVLERMVSKAESIWFTTSGQIAEHYVGVVPSNADLTRNPHRNFR